MKECYYSILGVESSATSDELKKAYRKKVLTLHPDKVMQSLGQEELSEERREQVNLAFNAVQEAYECLSSPSERAWYDNNKSYILRRDSSSGQQGVSSEYMSTASLMDFHFPSCYKGFTEGPKSFYAVYSNLFTRILMEEERSLQSDPDCLSHLAPAERVFFGGSNDAYYPSSNTFLFYQYFQHFSSCKSFYWFDLYNPLDYHSRPEKRMAEKHNKKAREDARKAFNNEVRDLCSFVKSRDPRYKEWTRLEDERSRQVAENRKREDERAALARKELAANYVEPEWSRVDNDLDEGDSDEMEDELFEEFECIVCEKMFKSLKQMENHELSKKHLENLDILKNQLQMEDLAIQDNEDDNESSTIPHEGSATDEEVDTEEVVTYECKVCDKIFDTNLQLAAHEQSKKHRQALKSAAKQSSTSGSGQTDEVTTSTSGAGSASEKKKRRAEKAKTANSNGLRCIVCKESFPSKTKLFNHIDATGHARAK